MQRAKNTGFQFIFFLSHMSCVCLRFFYFAPISVWLKTLKRNKQQQETDKLIRNNERNKATNTIRNCVWPKSGLLSTMLCKSLFDSFQQSLPLSEGHYIPAKNPLPVIIVCLWCVCFILYILFVLFVKVL